MGAYGFTGEDLKRLNDGRHAYDPAGHAIVPAEPDQGITDAIECAEALGLPDAAEPVDAFDFDGEDLDLGPATA